MGWGLGAPWFEIGLTLGRELNLEGSDQDLASVTASLHVVLIFSVSASSDWSCVCILSTSRGLGGAQALSWICNVPFGFEILEEL